MIVTVNTGDTTIDWGTTGNERIIQNVRNILRTRKFEVPFMRGMGLNPDHIDSAPNYIKSYIASDVIEALKEYEDRVDVTNVEVLSVDENGYYDILVEMEV